MTDEVGIRNSTGRGDRAVRVFLLWSPDAGTERNASAKRMGRRPPNEYNIYNRRGG